MLICTGYVQIENEKGRNAKTVLLDYKSVYDRWHIHIILCLNSSFLGSTAQLRLWPPPQNPAEFLGGFSTIFFFTG
jgi:hypothetical protein